MLKINRKRSIKLLYKKVLIKSQRLLEILLYLVRRFRNLAFIDVELNFKLNMRHSFILSGKQYIRSPRGYFSKTYSKLRVIDDVKEVPNVFWKNHIDARLQPPLYVLNEKRSEIFWNAPLASFILKITEGYVAPSGLVFDNEKIYRNGKWYYELPLDSLPILHFDKLITFVQLWSSGFVHFVFDTLPRINLSYKLICEETDIKILIPKSDSDFILRMFDAIGIARSRIIVQEQGYVYSADIVYYPHFYNEGKPQKMGLLPKGSFERIRHKLVGQFTEPRNKVVYLKRKKGCKRGIKNEDTVLENIKKRLSNNFLFVVHEPFNDWEKDKDVLKQARVVLGPHGGAWSNVLFCKEKTDVIEFLPLYSLKIKGGNERPCFYGLSNALNLNYWSVEPLNFEFEKLNGKMKIPIDEVLTVLNKIGVLRP